MEFPNSNFWNYSSQIWTLPEVESICLELQNTYDADVNILLYCCWVGDKNLSLNDDDMQVLLDTIKPWQTMLKPLRDSREMMQKQLIAMPTHLVDKTINNMNQMELNAEHLAQLALEKALCTDNITPCDSPSCIECSLYNINSYLHTLEELPAVDDAMPQIGKLLSSIYQDEEAIQVALMSGATHAIAK